jgi:hypothetical protein
MGGRPIRLKTSFRSVKGGRFLGQRDGLDSLLKPAKETPTGYQGLPGDGPSAGSLGLRYFFQYALGTWCLVTGVGKLLDLPSYVQLLRSYDGLPEPVLRPLALVLPLVELKVANWLLGGRRVRWGAAASTCLHVFYIAWTTAAMIRHLSILNCGGFGVFLARPLGWNTVIEYAFLFASSAALFKLAPL